MVFITYDRATKNRGTQVQNNYLAYCYTNTNTANATLSIVITNQPYSASYQALVTNIVRSQNRPLIRTAYYHRVEQEYYLHRPHSRYCQRSSFNRYETREGSLPHSSSLRNCSHGKVITTTPKLDTKLRFKASGSMFSSHMNRYVNRSTTIQSQDTS